jgi:hypothetical protein
MNSVYPGVPAVLQGRPGLGLATLRLHLKARRFRRADPRKIRPQPLLLGVYADTAGSLHHTPNTLPEELNVMRGFKW